MTLFNVFLSEINPRLIFDEIALQQNIQKFIKQADISDWSFHFNRIFISPGNLFNGKYLIKFLSTKLTKPKQISKICVPLTYSDNQLISQKSSFKAKDPQLFAVVNDVNISKNEYEEECVINDILDKLTDQEFFKLMDIEPKKRLEMIKYYYHTFNKILSDFPIDNLNNNLKTEIPYEIYIEESDYISLNLKNELSSSVKTVKSCDILKLLKTCGVVVIDVSRDNAALLKGKYIFRSIKKDYVRIKKQMFAMKNKKLIVIVSTVMTWAGSNDKIHTVSEKDVDNRIPNPDFMEHYKFELEVFAVNKTEGLKEFIKTVVIWTGLTYGYEQDLLKFAFDSACKNNVLLMPKCQNYIPVIHVENFSRLIYKIISENKMLKYNCIFATESPIITLKQIMTALGKMCNISILTSVSLNTFINKYKLQGIQEKFISANIKINSSISRLWPNFEWYCGKSTIIYKMEYLVKTYRKEHNIKCIKLLILGPPASGKTKLALKLSKYYNLMYLEPKTLIEKRINEIRKELKSRQANIYMDSLYLFENVDSQNEIKEIDPLISNKKIELEEELKTYLSLDANDGISKDTNLIQLFSKHIINSISSKCGYVLDGFPTTVDQFKNIFIDMSSFQQIDVKKLPDLAVILKQSELYDNLSLRFNEINIIASTQNSNNVKKHLEFSEVNNISSSNAKINSTTISSLNTVKSIFKKSLKNNYSLREYLIWNEQNHKDLLNILNYFCVPIKTIDFTDVTLDYDGNKIKVPEQDLVIEQFLNIIVNELEINQTHEFLDNSKKINVLIKEMNMKHTKNELEKLKEKMKLLEEFEKLITNFEHIENLSAEEYLIEYVTPTLTKCFVQVAKVRPKDPIYFMTQNLVKQNLEGSPDCLYYSKESIKIYKLLKRMFKICGYDVNSINSNPLMVLLAIHSTEMRKSLKNN